MQLTGASPERRCPGPDPLPRPPATPLPTGSCDTHAHVFGPVTRYAYAPERSYTPPDAPLDAYLGMLDAVGLQRGVLVQPSIYAADNRCLLDALQAAPDRLRGVVVLDPRELSDAEVAVLGSGGVCGVRMNMVAPGGLPVEQIVPIAARLADIGWHLDLIPDSVDRLLSLQPVLADLPCTLVIEQMGRISADRSLSDPAFAAVLRLVGDGRVWMKLSHGYHISRSGYPYRDTVGFAQALVKANPERILWGSDWPHPMVFDAMPNDGALLDLLSEWAPDEKIRHRILVSNPAALYGFAS